MSALSGLGDENMAFLGTYSSQIFNMYIGLGINLILGNQYNFVIFDENNMTSKLILFLIGYALFILCSQTFYVCLSDWVFKKGFVWQGYLTYIIFLIMMMVLVFYN